MVFIGQNLIPTFALFRLMHHVSCINMQILFTFSMNTRLGVKARPMASATSEKQRGTLKLVYESDIFSSKWTLNVSEVSIFFVRIKLECGFGPWEGTYIVGEAFLDKPFDSLFGGLVSSLEIFIVTRLGQMILLILDDVLFVQVEVYDAYLVHLVDFFWYQYQIGKFLVEFYNSLSSIFIISIITNSSLLNILNL